jgi:hypothetical protein
MRFLPLQFVALAWMGIYMNTTLQKIDIAEAHSITGLILCHRGEEVHLLVSRGTELLECSPRSRVGGPPRLVPAGELGGNGRNAWDARLADDTRAAFAIVYVHPESAVAWVMFRRPNGGEDLRLHLEPFAVYDNPHFVRGQPPSRWMVSAVKYDDEASVPVVFSLGEGGHGLPTSRAVGNYPHIHDARLVQDGANYWLFLLIRVPGAVDNPKVRELPTGGQVPAILHMVRLNADFAPTSKLSEVFGTLPIYEFDVDAEPKGHVVVFGTTPNGVVFGSGIPQEGKPLPREAWRETRFEQPLVSPSVLVQGRQVHLAAIANLAEKDAAVLYGTLPAE